MRGLKKMLISILLILLAVSLVLGMLIAYRHLLEPKVAEIMRGVVSERAGVP
jgi:hypothetical protein